MGGIRPDPGKRYTVINQTKWTTLIYPNKNSLVIRATQRTRVRTRNQVTKNMKSEHLQETIRL